MVRVYTILDEPFVDVEIQKHIDQTLRLLLVHKGRLGLISVILVGSFGRGEGSVLLEQGHVQPLNDYDFLLVTNKFFVSQSILKEISDSLVRELNIPRIDLNIIRYSDLPRLPNIIYFYEAKYGGKLIWGIDALSLMPLFRSEAIPLWDGALLLFARMVALISAYPPTCQGDDHFIIEQCVKAIFACSEALLILNRRYHYSYRERSKRLSSLLFQQTSSWCPKQLTNLAQLAIRFKLIPDYSLFPDPYILWHDVAHTFWPIFLHYMSSIYHSTQDIDDIVLKFLDTHHESPWKTSFVWLELWKSKKFSPVLGRHVFTHRPMFLVCAVLPYFLLSMLRSDKTYLKGLKYLSKVVSNTDFSSLQSAIKIVVDVWETSVH